MLLSAGGGFVVLWVLRVAAYGLSGFTVWNFFQGDASSLALLSAHKHMALDSSNGMVFGVCAGLSNYSGIDVTVIRLAWVLAGLYKGAGVVLYILAFLLMPMA